MKKIGSLPQLTHLATQMTHATKMYELQTRFRSWVVNNPSAACFQGDEDQIEEWLVRTVQNEYPHPLTQSDMKRANTLWKQYK